MLFKTKQSAAKAAHDEEAAAFNQPAQDSGLEPDKPAGEVRKKSASPLRTATPVSSWMARYIAGIINPPDPAPGLAYAGLWRRYAAFMIDFPLSLVMAMAMTMLIQAVLPRTWFFGGLVTLATMVITQMAYFMVFECSNWKATPGKRFLKLRVIDKRGQKISYLKSFVRLLIGMASMLLLLGFLMVGLNRKRQSFADRMLSTLVVRKKSESFLPKVLIPFEFPVVIALSVCLTVVSLESAARLVQPAVDRLTMRMMTEASLKLMEPAQLTIEDWVAKNKALPAQVDPRVIGGSNRGFPHTIAYNPASGAVTLWFTAEALQGKGLSMLPTMDAATGVITWRCAAVNLELDVTPGLCAPTKR